MVSQDTGVGQIYEPLPRLIRMSPEQRRIWLASQAGLSAPRYNSLIVTLPANQHSEAEAVRRLKEIATSLDVFVVSLLTDDRSATPHWSREQAPEILQLATERWLPDMQPDFLAAGGPFGALAVKRLTVSQSEDRWFVAADALHCDREGLRLLVEAWACTFDTAIRIDRSSQTQSFFSAVQRQERLLSSPQAKAMLEYWLRHFRDQRGETTGAAIGAHTVVDNSEPRYQRIRIPYSTISTLRRAQQRHNTKPDALMLCAWILLLRKVIKREEVTIGMVCRGRPTAETTGTIGCLQRYLPLTLKIDEGESVHHVHEQLVRHVAMHERLQASFAWEQMPGVGSAFRMMPYLFESHDLSPIQGRYQLEAGIAAGEPFLVRLSTGIGGREGDIAHLDYDAARYTRAQADAFAEGINTYLDALAASTAIRWERLPLVADQTRATLIAAGLGEARSEFTDHDRFDDIFRAGELRIVTDGTSPPPELQKGAVAVRTARRAAFFQSGLQLRQGQSILIDAPRSMDHVVTTIAALRAGLAFIEIDPAWPAQRKAEAYTLAAPALLVHSPDSSLAGRAERAITIEALVEAERGYETSWQAQAVHVESAAYQAFTSGSGGRPKLVRISRQALQNQLFWLHERLELNARDTVLMRTAAGFDAAIWESLLAAIAGATIVIPAAEAAFSADLLIAVVRRHSVSVMQVIPPLLHQLLNHPDFHLCTSLRLVVCGGDRLATALAEQFHATLPCRLINAYGPTECCVQVTAGEVVSDASAGGASASVGRAMANCGLYILDDQLDPVLSGGTGHLYIAGIPLATGYVDDAISTAQSFIPNPFSPETGRRMYRSGDIARFLADGAVEILGRQDRQIKINGIRIEPGEIEARLLEVPEIRRAVVLAIADEKGGYLVVVLVTSASATEVEMSARAHLEATLPASLHPARYVFVPELPQTDRGKIDVERLKALIARKRPTPYVAPSTETEAIVAEVWRTLLKHDDAGIHDDFFLSGGHSLLFAQLVIRLKERFGVSLSLKDIFQNPTISALAVLIDSGRAATRPKGEC